MGDFSYDNPKYGSKKVTFLGKLGANAASNTAQARFATYCNAKITEVYALGDAAGTAATSGWTIKKGTTSVGALVVGTTNTAGVMKAASLTDQTFTSTDVLNITNIGSDTQQSAWVYVVWQEAFA